MIVINIFKACSFIKSWKKVKFLRAHISNYMEEHDEDDSRLFTELDKKWDVGNY